MVDCILSIRQMMAEKKFSEALNFLESQISIGSVQPDGEISLIKLELLESLHRKFQPNLVLKAAEFLFEQDLNHADEWLNKIDKRKVSQSLLLTLKIQLSEKQGRVEELYQLLTELQLYLFENKIPAKLAVVTVFGEKYFKTDFKLKLQGLALALQRSDIVQAERLTRDLILSCFERTSVKSLNEKFSAVVSVLKLDETHSVLELYKTLLELYLQGFSSPKDYKKAAELVIHFDTFDFQVLVLNLLHQKATIEISAAMSEVLKTHPYFDFVYLDKHFPHLKNYFVKMQKPKRSVVEFIRPELGLIYPKQALEKSSLIDEQPFDFEQEQKLIQLFKFQEMNTSALCEVTISFLQSGFPRVAIKATEMALIQASSDQDKIKAYYLKLMCLMELKDFRLAIDTSMEALKLAQSQDELLSFLYCQAEAYTQIGMRKQARTIYKKISSIDPSYRLTKERLDKLDAI